MCRALFAVIIVVAVVVVVPRSISLRVGGSKGGFAVTVTVPVVAAEASEAVVFMPVAAAAARRVGSADEEGSRPDCSRLLPLPLNIG